MKRFLTIVMLLSGLFAGAQNESGVDVEADLYSSYYWRGASLYNTPGITADLTFYHQSLSLNAWAFASVDGLYSEVDLTPSWSFGNFTLYASDFYYQEYGKESNYFDFSKENSNHSAELGLEYEAGKLPVNLTLATFIFGDNDASGKANYSTYFQVGYPFSIAGLDAQVELGITPMAGYYADGFALVHLALGLSHSIELPGEATLPLNLSFNINPDRKEALFVIGIGLAKSFSK